MDLFKLLEPTARAMRAQAYALARAVSTFEGGQLLDEDFEALTDSSAFLAFTTLGGDVDDPASFDWAANASALVKVGLTFLRADLGINYREGVMRNASRKNGCMVEELSWDSWQGTAHTNSQAAEWMIYRSDFEPDKAFRQSMLDRLETLITTELGAETAQIVCDHYFRGVQQRAIAERLAAERGTTVAKAERVINKAISRARAKLRAVLDPEWLTLAKEVA